MKPHSNAWYGCKRDLKDARDHMFAPRAVRLPSSVDLRPHCPPVMDQGDLGACHDSKTEILTDRGWVVFPDLTGGERLATVNPETSEMIFERPLRLIRMPYQGKMICARNQS